MQAILIVAISLASGSLWAGPTTASEAVPGEILVRLQPGPLAAESVLPLAGRLGLERLPSQSGLLLFRLKEGDETAAAIKRFAAHTLVRYAQPNYIARLTTASDFPPIQDRPGEVTPPVPDPELNRSYGLKLTRAFDAWNITHGSAAIVVGVIDSGIDYNHPDLAFNMWRNPSPSTEQDLVGYNFLSKNGLPYDDDEMKGHGTHAAGIIGAVGGNGVGVSGINQRVSLMALKGFSAFGYSTTEVLVAAINYGVDHGAHVLSNSWASGQKDNPAMIEAIEYARTKGVLFVVAAGNSRADNDDDKTASYPAGWHIDNILAVAATDEDDRLASFSNYGKTTVMLGAPGVNIYSTLPGGKWGWESGTSMACPLVAGAAALVWSQHPDWNYLQVKKALVNTVDPLPDLTGKVATGGRLNVLRALTEAAATQAPVSASATVLHPVRPHSVAVSPHRSELFSSSVEVRKNIPRGLL